MKDGAIRVGLIGCGYISTRHLIGWREARGVKVVAVCDADPARAQRQAEAFGIERVYSDAERMLSEAPVDAVDIATPPESHAALVEMADGAGKHVLCQKPLAPDPHQALSIVRTCSQAGVRLMVAENWRWHIWYRRVKEILRSGVLGKIRRVAFTHSSLFDQAQRNRGAPSFTGAGNM